MSESPWPPASSVSQKPGAAAGSCTSRLPLLRRMRSVVMTDSRTFMPPSFAMAALQWHEGRGSNNNLAQAKMHCVLLPGTHAISRTLTASCQGWSGLPHDETSNSSRPMEDMTDLQERCRTGNRCAPRAVKEVQLWGLRAGCRTGGSTGRLLFKSGQYKACTCWQASLPGCPA